MDWASMDWVIVAVSASLGGIVGWLAWETYVRQPEWNVKAVSAIISLMALPAGTGIIQTIAGTTSALPPEVWFYPVGFLLGASVFAVQHAYHRKRETERQEREKDRETARQKREKDRETERQEREKDRETERQERDKDRETERQEREKDRDLIYDFIKTRVNSVTRKADYTMMGFGTLRNNLQNPQWDDNFFGKIIREYPHVFEYARVRGRPGIKIIGLSSSSNLPVALTSNDVANVARSLPYPEEHDPACDANRGGKRNRESCRASPQIIRGGKTRDPPSKNNRPDGRAAEQ
jgi:hypothetical protein